MDVKRKIVILRLHVGSFGAVGTYNVQEIGLANALLKLGHEVNVLYCNRQVSQLTRSDVYDYVYYLPHRSFGIHGICDVKIIGRFTPDTVILFSDNQLWAKNVIRYCEKKSIKCIHYFGNVLSDNPAWLNQAYTKMILLRNRKSYNISINVAKTNKVQQEMERHHIPCEKVINIGLDNDLLQDKQNPDPEIRKSLGIKEDEFVLLFVGRLVDYKKPLMACDILIDLLARGINGKLIIIGDGPLAWKLEKHIEENKIENRVKWEKKVPYENMYKYMVSCDCCINLSSKEIFGMTVLEAMYYGAIVIAHEAPGPNDIIEDNISGFICNFDDVEKWADKILKVQSQREKISHEAQKRIKNSFLWDSIAKEFLNIL